MPSSSVVPPLRLPASLDPGGRTPERLYAHYEIERELADRLRAAPPERRDALYGEVYDELFARVPDHPQLTRPDDAAAGERLLVEQERILRPLLRPDATFMEIGAGDCGLTVRVARRVRRAIGIEVSATIAAPADAPENFELRITDGRSFPVDDGSVDVAYSNQLLEHLHPDDAAEHARNVLRTLAPSGAYLCLTPHRLFGPADISGFFDEVPTGFHLREYGTGDLVELFRGAGFARVRVVTLIEGRVRTLPAAPFVLLERIVERLPRRVRRSRVVQKLVNPGGGVVALRG